MNKKPRNRYRYISECSNQLFLPGAIIFSIGIYYAVIKAGIPYQDAPLELQIKYTVYEKIATELTMIGIQIIILGGLLRGAIWLLKKQSRRHAKKD